MKLYQYEGRCNISGKNIRRIREARDLSQEQLAAQMQLNDLPINQKCISRIETGDRIVTDYELMLLAKVLKVDVKFLLKKK